MEFLDIVDSSGNPTGDIVERTAAHTYGIPHRTSHVWITRTYLGVPQLLLQMRCKDKDSFPGCFDISSAGHIPAGDDYTVSALRELKEELGVSVSADELVYCGSRQGSFRAVFHGKPFCDRELTNVYLLQLDREASEFAPQPEEIDYVKWIDFEECVSAVLHNSIPHCIYMEELELLRPHL